MTIPRNLIQTLALVLPSLVLSGAVHGQKNLDHAPATLLAASENSNQVRLKLGDGSYIAADEAWETGAGIWYRQGGMSHLITRERVKGIQRGAISKPKRDLQVAKVAVTNDADTRSDHSSSANDQPVWIYLVGGARVEADGVTESAAGAWYRRGSLSAFVEIDGWIRQSGSKYGVDPYLIFCVMEQESHFNAHALSPKGARGLMQLMPGTSARLGVTRPSDPAQNIAGGTRYLKQLIQQFDGRIDLVLASYNAGEGAVMKFGRKVPPYRETRAYVKRISYRYHGSKPVVPSKNEVATAAGALL